MSTVEAPAIPASATAAVWRLLQWLAVVMLVYFLLAAVGLIATGFKMAAGDQARSLFEFARNPFSGLVIGTVATAIIQSSSTVSSIIVGLVAGGMPVEIAIPMIMGANIGTSLTNTIVSLGHIRAGEEFRRAFAAATIHDFFNLLSVVVFLPLEMIFRPLERLSYWTSGFLSGTGPVDTDGIDLMDAAISPLVDGLARLAAAWASPLVAGVLLSVAGVVGILVVIMGLSRLLRSIMVGRALRWLNAAMGRGPVSGILFGTGITVLVQSSSTTTSLVVPLAATGHFSLRQIYPFTLGANIGTCITALLAATAVTEGNTRFGMEIALVHFWYNVLGVVIIYGLPFLRDLPVRCAEWLADLSTRNKLCAFGYIAAVFFIIPSLLLGVTKMLG
ncbi:MAG: Na/Pi symporter [Verrucomicrobiaceae bacterium]|jgi:sodium-dependent phosphate cotransporter|nr:Na/Pi symporter [Verrucomicrobiaceae bacterium]